MGSKHEDSLLMFQDKDRNWVLTPPGCKDLRRDGR
jgi:hypothetical protein